MNISFLLLYRLQALGQPFLAFHPGLLRETLAYHGCAELFQVSCLNPFIFCMEYLALLLGIIVLFHSKWDDAFCKFSLLLSI